MRKTQVIGIVALLLVIIGVAMIAIGIKMRILPPPLTGVGFMLIAWALWTMRK
ncbi:MAG: hypothetical protein ACFB0B_02140 [Thermonemataceae bacterium]